MIKSKKAQLSTTMKFVIGIAFLLVLMFVVWKFKVWSCGPFPELFYCP